MDGNILFYRCEICGNIISLIKNGGGQIVCCGQPMTKLEPNTVDASIEKHVPVAKRKDGKLYVEVGSAPHPMTEAHLIEWIIVANGRNTQGILLNASDKPEAVFSDMEDADVYAYCNLHGLWKSSSKQ